MPFDERYYDRVYRSYSGQNPPRKLRFYRRLLEAHLRVEARPRILDLGCAFGSFLGSLGADYRKYGMDISPYSVGMAARKFADSRFVVGDCARPPFGCRFDAIVALDVLEHVKDLDRVSEFARSALSSDGIFLFVVPVYDGPTGWVVDCLDRDETHVHTRSRRWWLEWAAGNFTVEHWTGIVRYFLPIRYYVHIPTVRFRRVAPAIAIVARNRQIPA